MESAVAKREDFQISMADVKKYIAPGATDKELFVFMGVAKSYGLNPMKREIHFVKYGQNPGQVIVGYESYIKRAESTGKLDGWKVSIADMGKPEERAIIEIRRKDFSQPFVWEVYRKEFDKGQANWKNMPTFMLKKVAIAQGFRLAFPSEIGGMPYVPEELPSDKVGPASSENLAKGAIEIPPETQEPDDVPDYPEFDETIIPELKKQINAKMRGFTPAQKVEFFEFVIGGEVTVDKLQSFLDRFEEARAAYMKSKEAH
jgi:phage recombination protein Bet